MKTGHRSTRGRAISGRGILGLLSVLVCVLALFPDRCRCGEIEDRVIDPETRAAIIDSVAATLRDFYVFPDVAEEMENRLRERHREGAYEDLASLFAFAQRLTEDLREVNGDGHLRVEFRPDAYFEPLEDDTITEEELREEREEEAYENHGFLKVERLRGNVGYVQMNGFHDASRAGGTAAAAMSFIACCDAVIIDLRLTLGGSPTMDQLLASYFFEEPTELSAFHRRTEEGGDIKQFWTLPYVPGPKPSKADLYVLTSRQTPSAAEAFAYDMKHLGRATIVGEKTAGAAHPSATHVFPGLNLIMRVPFGRPVNPVTGTNWEGVGVEPDVEVPSDEALDRAHLLALEKIRDRCGDEKRRGKIEWARSWIEGEREPARLSPDQLREFEGTYGPRVVALVGDHLEARRGAGDPHRLVPIGGDTFLLENLYYVRYRFGRDEAGRVAEILSLTEEGPSSVYAKER
ncbi:MAG: S41 family peptidase [Candidatus Eisenbacteria bacterium]